MIGMNRYRSLIVGLFLMAGSSPSQVDSFQIQNGHAGKLHVGMTVGEFYSAVGKQSVRLLDLDLEGMFSPALEVRSGDRVLLHAEFDKRSGDWVITRITLKDTRFRTRKGIGVGSTYADLKAAYPQLDLFRGEGGQVAVVEPESLSFVFDFEPPSAASRVRSILIFK